MSVTDFPVLCGSALIGGHLERGDEPDTVEYLDQPTRYACLNTRRALVLSGIAVPPFES